MEDFRHELQDTLTHLHDPDFQPSARIFAALGCAQEQGAGAVQVALTHLIEQPRQTGELAGSGLNAAERQLLQQRFVLKLTQEESAAHLNMSVRTLQRVQRRAVYMLARALWERSVGLNTHDQTHDRTHNQTHDNVHDRTHAESATTAVAESASELSRDWHSQVEQELASLRKGSPNALSDVGVSLARALTVGQAVADKRGITVEIIAAPENLLAAIHPSALRHVLITAIEQMAQRMAGGTITLNASHQEETVRITVKGAPQAAGNAPDRELMTDIVTTHGGTVTVTGSGDAMAFQIALPSRGKKVVVLVIDDNADLVAFYRRYVAGTHYEIKHLADGNHLFAAIEATLPAIIVLDVLLPDADGWELLTYLHEHPATRTIPILVASVVRSKELALALGAVGFLPKPVRRQEFIQALDQVRARGRE